MNLYTRTEFIITELVDSILRRDSADTQYMTNNMHSGAKKHCENTEPESCQMAKYSSFFFFR